MRVCIAGLFILCCLLAWLNQCYMEDRFAIWKQAGTTKPRLSTRVKQACAEKYLGPEYVGVRMKINESGACESLPYEWLADKILSEGYLYMFKTWNKIIMNPPLVLDLGTKSDYRAYLPGIFSDGSSMTVTYSPDPKHETTYIVLDAEKEGSILFHISKRNGADPEKRLRFYNLIISDQSHEQSIDDFPICANNICELTFSAGSQYIDMQEKHTFRFRIELGNISPTVLRSFEIRTSTNAFDSRPINLTSLEFTLN